MKKIFTVIGFLFSASLFAQNDNAVVTALKNVNVDQFTNYFAGSVDLTLPPKKEMPNQSKAEATSTIKSFFSTNKIDGFELISQREMSGTMYVAGKLKSGLTSYNITVMLKNKGDTPSVITIRIN